MIGTFILRPRALYSINIIMKANFLGAAVFAGGALAGVTSEPQPLTSRPPQSTIAPTLASIYAAAATATPQSPVSNVAGKAFDRIIQIWLENTDYNVSCAVRSPAPPLTSTGRRGRPQHAVDRQPGHPAHQLLCRYVWVEVEITSQV